MIADMRGAVMAASVMLAACGSWSAIAPSELANHGGEVVRASTAARTVVLDEAMVDGDTIVGTVHGRDQVVRIPVRSVSSLEVRDGSTGTAMAFGIAGGATVIIIAIAVTNSKPVHF